MNNDKTRLCEMLEQLGIKGTNYKHERLYTVEEARAANLPHLPCKNLFLKDSKKKLWLVVALGDTKIALKELGKKIGAPELRFVDDQLLKQYLGVEPGSVTPFGLINDTDHLVTVILDAAMFSQESVGFHPLTNDETTYIKPEDLKKFIQAQGNPIIDIDFQAT